MGSIIFQTAIAFVGCTIIGSLVNAIAQIAFSEGMAEIVIAIMAIPIAALADPMTTVITVIVIVVPAVVVSTTIMTTVSALTVVWWVVIARATLVGWLWAT